MQALQFQRAYGGGAVLVGVNDGAGLDQLREPVREGSIRAVDFLTVFDASECQAIAWQNNPIARGFGEPEIYRLNPRSPGGVDAKGNIGNLGNVEVHASRILRFSGPVASRADLASNQGWGMSIFNRIMLVLRDFGASWDSASALLADFAQAVYKIKGLADLIATDREGVVLKRLKLMDLSRSYLRGIVLDAEGEDFERKPTPIAGLPDLMDRFCNRLAAAVDMPVAMLMGQAPAGLNATGAENTRYFYDRIANMQRSQVKPELDKLVRYLMLARGTEPDVWELRFRPLWQLDDVQKAAIRANLATADNAMIAAGVVTPEEVADSRYGGDEFGLDLKLDVEAREAFASTEPAEVDDLDDEAEGAPAPVPSPAPTVPAGGPAPAPAPTVPGEAKVADTALNGAQVTSAQGIVVSVAEGKLPRDSGIAMLVHFFQLERPAAEEIMGTVGGSFVPKADPAPAPPGDPEQPPTKHPPSKPKPPLPGKE
jgi:phage-related protein (TIGR01555 family)